MAANRARIRKRKPERQRHDHDVPRGSGRPPDRPDHDHRGLPHRGRYGQGRNRLRRRKRHAHVRPRGEGERVRGDREGRRRRRRRWTFHVRLKNSTGGGSIHPDKGRATGRITNTETAVLSATFPASGFMSSSHKGADDRPQVIVEFSEGVASFDKSTPSVAVTEGTVSSGAHTEDGLEHACIFWLTPGGDHEMTFALVANLACDAGGICTEAGTPLTEVPRARTIPGPDDSNPDAGRSPKVDRAAARRADSTGSSPRAARTSIRTSRARLRKSLRTQPARTLLVLGVSLDQTIEGPRAVNGHGNAPFRPIRPVRASLDYAESRNPIKSRKPVFQNYLRMNLGADSAYLAAGAA